MATSCVVEVYEETCAGPSAVAVASSTAAEDELVVAATLAVVLELVDATDHRERS